jgi:hypothetical protein
MPDFTRFDFNAHDFLNSESVEAMTDAEIGQYIMLMAKSWLIAKAASLPDDLDLLARWAHCPKVSERVLAKFPLMDTEFGPRRRNEVLYKEWIKTLNRTTSASENGKIGAAARWGGYAVPNGVANDGVITQTNPSHTIPNQANPSSADFRNIAVRYRKAFRVNLNHGPFQKTAYAEACAKFGEDTVLAQFEIWAPEQAWIKEKKHTNGLRSFYDSLSAAVEADTEIAAEQTITAATEALQESSVALSQELGRKAAEESRDARLAEIAELETWAKAHKEIPF